MITLRIYRRSGELPLIGEKVTVSSGDGQRSATTNREGVVDFELNSGREYRVYVRGREVYQGVISGVHTVYI